MKGSFLSVNIQVRRFNIAALVTEDYEERSLLLVCQMGVVTEDS